jgi:hypothetical protein
LAAEKRASGRSDELVALIRRSSKANGSMAAKFLAAAERKEATTHAAARPVSV